MYKLGSNSCSGYFLSAISLNFKDLLKENIRHYREVPNKNILSKDEGISFKKIAADKDIKCSKVKYIREKENKQDS